MLDMLPIFSGPRFLRRSMPMGGSHQGRRMRKFESWLTFGGIKMLAFP